MHTQTVLKQRTDQSLTLKTITAWLLFFLLFPVLSHADRTLRIEPEFPVAGESISLYYQGCEPPFPHVESGDLFYTERTDDLIQFVGFFTFSLPLCPTTSEYTYELGTYEAGEYDIEVYLFLAIENLPINLDIRTPHVTFPITVAAPPAPVAVNNTLGLLILTLILLLFTRKTLKMTPST